MNFISKLVFDGY